MKKILSIALALTMLLSLAAVLAIPTAAVDGEWHVVYGAGYYQPDFDDEEPSLSGYEYTDDGFHTIPTGAWELGTPHLSIQTKNKVDLKEGVYFEVRIDKFTYAGDKWFNLHIWDSVGISPGSGEEKYGSGVQNLFRPGNSPDAEDLTKPGTVSGASWYINQFTGAGSSSVVAEQNKTTEDGQPIMAMTVTWDGSTYALDINGAAAPQAVIDFMNQKWGGNDSEAYIGLNAQNSTKGGTVEVTVLKFGTDKDSATTPMGDDSAEPINNSIPPVDIMDPNTVEANQPAIMLNGDKENSDVVSVPKASNGGFSTVNDDFSIHVVAERSGMTASNYSVKKTVSYDIKDFPIAITLTRNFCTCGNEDGSCDAFETANYYIMAGEVLQASNEWLTSVLDMSYNSYAIDNEDGSTDTYLYFFCDFSEEFAEPLEGRINGLRFDVAGLDINSEGGNTFDVMFTAFFRTTEEAEAFVVQYLIDNYGLSNPDDETDPVEDTTEDKGGEATTEDKGGEADTEDKGGEATTEDKGGEATTEKKADETEKPAEGGCASVIGFSAIAAVVAVAAAGVVSFRKKND